MAIREMPLKPFCPLKQGIGRNNILMLVEPIEETGHAAAQFRQGCVSFWDRLNAR